MFKKVVMAVALSAIISVTGSATATAAGATYSSTTVAVSQLHGLTSGQQNAVRHAKAYLQTMPFSRAGLIDQLKYEGYSTRNATFAVDYIKVSWKNQAYKMARSYLSMMPFSLSGLIEQLRYEGFTRRQAASGAKRAL